jgi:hypothetical protein
LSFAKYFFSGRFLHCFDLAEKWAPEAVKAAIKGLSSRSPEVHKECISCATEVVKKMGASDEEMLMVAGFAGGLGLSGSGCGALSAAIWMRSLEWNRKEKKKSSFKNPRSKEVLETFLAVSDSRILCSEITGTSFTSIDEHTSFIKNGGCSQLINSLAKT